MTQSDLSNVVFSFFGPPGSGKGTVARMCEEKLGFRILSTGNLCRKHITEKTEIGNKIEALINAGHLISDDLVTKMVIEWLEVQLKSGHPIILDGYPRTASQYELFEKTYQANGYDFDFKIVFFEISDEDIIARLTSRMVCSNKNCQAIYSTVSARPKVEAICDKCSSSLIRRNDDDIEVIRERLRKFAEYKKEVIEYFKSKGQAVSNLDLAGKDKEQVFNDFKRLL